MPNIQELNQRVQHLLAEANHKYTPIDEGDLRDSLKFFSRKVPNGYKFKAYWDNDYSRHVDRNKPFSKKVLAYVMRKLKAQYVAEFGKEYVKENIKISRVGTRKRKKKA